MTEEEYQFLHMGCNLELSEQAAEETDGVTLYEQQYAGSRLQAANKQAEKAYFQRYRTLLTGLEQKDLEVSPPYRDLSATLWFEIARICPVQCKLCQITEKKNAPSNCS